MELDAGAAVHVSRLPDALVPGADAFERLWALHPAERHVILMRGRPVATPRWQQAYGADYHYTGRVNEALPLTPEMEPLLAWCRAEVDPRLNGLLFNWYDAAQRHYIGAHRDSEIGRIAGAPIVTLSFGAPRLFRFRRWKTRLTWDLEVADGSVVVIPWDVNRAYTHEVPHRARDTGRRISVTARAFLRTGGSSTMRACTPSTS